MTTTLITWRERYPERTGSLALEMLTREYKRAFFAEMSDGEGGPDNVVNLAQLAGVCPVLGDSYVAFNGDTDLYSFAKRISARQEKDRKLWVVEIEYSSDIDTRNPTGNPLLEPAKVTWGRKTLNVPLIQCNDGAAVLNSAGFPYDPPPMVEMPWRTLRVEKNFAVYDQTQAVAYEDTVNSLAWVFGGVTIAGIGEARCLSITAHNDFKRGAEFWPHVFEFEVRAGWGVSAWAEVLLDQGYAGWNPVNSRWEWFRELYGAQVTKPLLLDGAGAILGHGLPPVFLTFYYLDDADFNLLAIP